MSIEPNWSFSHFFIEKKDQVCVKSGVFDENSAILKKILKTKRNFNEFPKISTKNFKI